MISSHASFRVGDEDQATCNLAIEYRRQHSKGKRAKLRSPEETRAKDDDARVIGRRIFANVPNPAISGDEDTSLVLGSYQQVGVLRPR